MDFDINTDRCEEDLGASSFDSVDESVLDFMESQPQREVVNLYKYIISLSCFVIFVKI